MSATEISIESVSLVELKSMLNRNIVAGSTIGTESVNGVKTETRTVSISPTLAEALLNKNTINRPVTASNVNKIALAMSNNEWKFDGTPITFDKYGNLLNGQHRLLAIVKSKKTNIFKVSTGFNPEIFATMDIGKTRTGSDVLAIAGIENYHLIAQTANFLYKFIQGSISQNAAKPSRQAQNPTKGLTHPELLKFVEIKPLLKESVVFQIKMKKLQPVSILSNYVVSGLYFLFAEKNKTDAETFLTRLLTGQGLELDSPIFHLRNRLLNSKLDKTKRLQYNEMIKLVIVAWNKFRKGEKTKAIKVPEALPVII